MRKNKPYVPQTVYTPTLTDAAGRVHMIRSKGGAPLCGAPLVGKQQAPIEYRRDKLCQGCLQKYMRELFDIRLGEFGL